MIVNDTNRALVLAALYNASQPLGFGVMHYNSKDMTEDEAAEILAGHPSGYFDYLRGRVMKMHLGKPGEAIIDLDFRLYDRDNGDGAGARACKGLEV
jgi:hypothetical protein